MVLKTNLADARSTKANNISFQKNVIYLLKECYRSNSQKKFQELEEALAGGLALSCAIEGHAEKYIPHLIVSWQRQEIYTIIQESLPKQEQELFEEFYKKSTYR